MMLAPTKPGVHVVTYGRLHVIVDSLTRLIGVAVHDITNDRFSVSLCGQVDAKPAPRRARGRARLSAAQRRRNDLCAMEHASLTPLSAAPSMGAYRVEGKP